MLGFGQQPFGAQMVQGPMGMPQPGMQGASNIPGMGSPGMQQPNMAPQIPQMQRPMTGMQMPGMPPMAPIQLHDNGLLQMLLGPALNGQNGQALGLLKMLAQMPRTPPINPQGAPQAPGGSPPPFFSPSQSQALGPQTPAQMPPNFGGFLNLFGQGQ